MEKGKQFNLAIVGGTGFVGSALIKALEPTVNIYLFSRKKKSENQAPIQHIYYQSNAELSKYVATLPLDGLINLAGHPVADGRWTKFKKQLIYDSRIQTTRALVEGILQRHTPLAFLVNASAIGYYGDTGDRETDESGLSGEDYLAQICRDWEQEALKAENAAVRVVLLRFGMILGNGGALPKLIRPFRFFIGGPAGSGKQWISWIHISDVVRIILESIKNPYYTGPINCVSPQPVRMKQFSETLGHLLHRPSWLRVPEWLLQIILGEGASVITSSQRIIPARLHDRNFTFNHPIFVDALSDILKSTKK